MDLRRFGFTPTESKVYLALLRLPQATGYALAREARLARANAYAALEGLVRRGAATRLAGRPARYAAVGVESLVGRLRREFARDTDALARELDAAQRSAAPAVETPLEVLDDRDGLIELFRSGARAAGEELLAVVGPWVSEVYADLAAARGRVRTVRIVSLGAPAPEGATIRSVPLGEVEAYWGGWPVLLVADRRHAVSGIVRADGSAAALSARHAALVPFLRHLLRRELAAPPQQRAF